GKIGANIWPPASRRYEEIPKGALVDAEGHADIYKERLQFNIRWLELLDPEDQAYESVAEFAPVGKYDPALLFRELRQLCRRELKHQPLLDLLEAVFGDPGLRKQLLLAPAAKSVHQAYAGGLLEHTLNVARICLALADLYPGLDRQILLAGAALHDLGKIREYDAGVVIDYTQAGQLLGHTFLGLEILEPFLAASHLEEGLKEHLKHLILSHHGEHEYGAARLPQTIEAFALHHADNLDAKLDICMASFPDQSQRPAWSPRIPWLERAIFLPVRTPAPDDDESCGAPDVKKRDGQAIMGSLI
ncbi:MAG: HD domain-containing protein, partial [Desulfovibrio sp.]|nr:HD domain-containing protein [Desulfovibrio sp.]